MRRAARAATALLVVLGGSVACRSAAVRAPSGGAFADTTAATPWRVLTCPSCVAAHVTVEVRPSRGPSGHAGQHELARVRNENPYAVALVLRLVPEYTEHGDGYVPAEVWPLYLGPAGDAMADTVLLLRRRGPVEASVHQVERF